MKSISDFFARFANLAPPNDSIKSALVRALDAIVGISCGKADIAIRGGVAFVKVSSVAKSAIQVNRSKILEYLFERLPKARDSVRDIR